MFANPRLKSWSPWNDALQGVAQPVLSLMTCLVIIFFAEAVSGTVLAKGFRVLGFHWVGDGAHRAAISECSFLKGIFGDEDFFANEKRSSFDRLSAGGSA